MVSRVRFLVTVAAADAVYVGGNEYWLPKDKAAEVIREGIARPIGSPERGTRASYWQAKTSPGDILDWQVRVRLSLLAALRIRPQHLPRERAVWDKPSRRRSPYVQEVGGFGEGPGRPQASALDYLVAHEEKIRDRALAALAVDACRNYRRGWVTNAGIDVADRVVPERMTAADVAERVEVNSVVITPKALGTTAYIELHGNCVWDIEHGFVVVLHRERVVVVCQQGTGWVDRKRARRKR